MRIQQWIDHLKSNFKQQGIQCDVKGAVDMAAAEKKQTRDAVFVFYADDNASDNSLGNGVRQQRTIGIAVVMALTNRRHSRGEAGVDEIETMRKQIECAFLGWEPDDSFDQVTFRRGRLLSFDGGTIWWQDEYQVPVLISSTNKT